MSVLTFSQKLKRLSRVYWGAAAQSTAQEILAGARRDAPRATGALAASGESQVQRRANTWSIRVAFNKPYARAHERGSGLHAQRSYIREYIHIVPVQVGITKLKFRGSNGDIVYTQHVAHPGVRGRGYIKRNIVAGRRALKRRVRQTLRDAFR